MKRVLYCLGVLTVLAPIVAHAQQAEPSRLLLVRTQDPGFVPPGLRVGNVCKIYSDRLVIVRWFEQAGTEEVRPLYVSEGMDALIAAAAAGPIDRQVGPTDIPGKVYMAVQHDADGRETRIDLGSTRSGAFTHNNAAEAGGLKRFLDLHCP
jgi:hypothetical protein